VTGQLATVSTTGYTPINAHEAPTGSVCIYSTVKRLKVTIFGKSDPRGSLRYDLRPLTENVSLAALFFISIDIANATATPIVRSTRRSP